MINEENKIYFSILAQGKDPDDIIKDSGKDGFLKFLENKIIIQSFIWETYLNKINTGNPYEVTKFEKQIRKLCTSIKDDTLRKYIYSSKLVPIKRTATISDKSRTCPCCTNVPADSLNTLGKYLASKFLTIGLNNR